ncbi:SDR family NAD(P)-dependent oxidoreductase [Planctomycetota bacterium]
MISDLFGLQGKTALVTGSSRGLGLGLAKGLAQAGATVILNGRNPDPLDQAVEQLQKEKLTVYGYTFDVRNEDEINEKIKHIEKNVAPIDILVNNAGVQIRSPLEDFKKEDWQHIMDVNAMGAFLTAKAVVKNMIKQKAGKIIHTCSMQCEFARPTIGPYTASKGALRNLTKAMATEWGKYNIQTNGIAPGYFKTEMTKPLYEDEKFDAWLCARTPANRWGDLSELIGTLVFLSSPASSYVNGQIIYVDGGMMACL